MHRNQLFIIPPDTWAGLSESEVTATAAAMKECKIYALPYPNVDIWLPANEKFGWPKKHLLEDTDFTEAELLRDVASGLYKCNKDQYTPAKGSGLVFEFRNISLEHLNYTIHMHVEPATPAAKIYRTVIATPGVQNPPETAGTCRDSIAMALIVLLATRNTVKTTVQHKCARLGIGKRHKHEYVTTITLPREMPQDPENPNSIPGSPRCPHLRRGHVRRQHHGPHNSLVKQIWIEPVFVNADPNFVSARKQYNISM